MLAGLVKGRSHLGRRVRLEAQVNQQVLGGVSQKPGALRQLCQVSQDAACSGWIWPWIVSAWLEEVKRLVVVLMAAINKAPITHHLF